MDQPSSDTEKKVIEVLSQIRCVRENMNISQQTLAEASGLSRNTLSLIERGQSSPRLTTLQKIAEALCVDISTLIQEKSSIQAAGSKSDADGQGSLQKSSSDQGTYGIEGLISALILRLEPKARCGSLLQHSGTIFVYCLVGRCLISVDQQRYLLDSGDSLHFNGNLHHYCQNLANTTTRALVIFLDLVA